MELKASEWFTWWGTFVAKHKIIVMMSSMVIATVFALGMVKMIITTDPVELWAGPNSRSRIEKDFFDSNFRPFYRTEMVIIKAKNLDTVIIYILILLTFVLYFFYILFFHIFIVFLITRIFLDSLYRLSGCRSSIRPNFQWHTFSEAIARVAKVYRESYSPRWDYTQRHLSTAPSSVRCLYNSKYLGIFSRLGWEARWDIQRWCFIRNYQSDRKLLGSFYWMCRVRFWN